MPHDGLSGDTDADVYVSVKYFAAASLRLSQIAAHSDSTDVAGGRRCVFRTFADWTIDIDLSLAADAAAAVLARHEIGPLAGFSG